MIERNIFQCAPTYADLPVEIIKNIDFLKKNNPGWEHRFYDNEQMRAEIKDFGFDISKLNPEYPIMIADIFRYVALYRYGGVYLDIKSTCTQPFDNFLYNKDALVAKWSTTNAQGNRQYIGSHPLYNIFDLKGEIANWFIAAQKGHSLLMRTLEKIQKNIKKYPSKFCNGVGAQGVLALTGPVPFTMAAFDADMYWSATEYERVGLRYTIFGSGNEHRKLFKNHYSTLSSPLVVS